MRFEYEEKEIDVIIINLKGYAPYYLENAATDKKVKKNQIVNAGSIYTRVEDKNTSINSTASPLDTEILWKMHFGLYPSPIKRLQNYLLIPEKWILDSTDYFYSESPKYIVCENENIAEKENYFNSGIPFYTYNQINSNIYIHIMNSNIIVQFYIVVSVSLWI
ncbi:hypothetical protein ACUXPG_000179 [Staphylococcus hominis]